MRYILQFDYLKIQGNSVATVCMNATVTAVSSNFYELKINYAPNCFLKSS